MENCVIGKNDVGRRDVRFWPWPTFLDGPPAISFDPSHLLQRQQRR